MVHDISEGKSVKEKGKEKSIELEEIIVVFLQRGGEIKSWLDC